MLRDPATLPDAEQVTAQGLTDAVGHACATMKMRMLLDAGPSQPAAGGAGREQALADGALDTATGACLDFTNSPYGLPGQPCTASFLDCLACSNAVATRRHLPRLAWLHRALDELRATVPRGDMGAGLAHPLPAADHPAGGQHHRRRAPGSGPRRQRY